LEPVDTPCEINIKIFKKNDFCTILLSDNGPGMNVLPSEKIISKGDSSGNGIGLSNIRERLQLLYGDSSIFSIHSVASKGTTIQLQIPIRKGD
jgi:two-component system sensor histidine kinase YesM